MDGVDGGQPEAGRQDPVVRGRRAAALDVAEDRHAGLEAGAGLDLVGQQLEREIEQRTGFEARATVLGHIQRGGTPTAFDRVLATRLGLAAIDAAHEQRFGMMPALKGSKIELVPLGDAVAQLRTVPDDEYAVAEAFFG